ncbi:MAG: DnaJ domain-containing protein [Spirochaetales bacterium]|nr:DnaJ domain-containing protein [Spirochaetales bacterium]
METMYDKLGDLLNETLKSGQVKFKKKIKYSEEEIPHEEKKSEKNFTKENVSKNKTKTEQKKQTELLNNKFSYLKKITPEIERACRLLDITASANSNDVKKAYKEKLKYFHPDKYDKNPVLKKVATNKTRMIVEAYELLMNSF